MSSFQFMTISLYFYFISKNIHELNLCIIIFVFGYTRQILIMLCIYLIWQIIELAMHQTFMAYISRIKGLILP